MTRVADLLFKE